MITWWFICSPFCEAQLAPAAAPGPSLQLGPSSGSCPFWVPPDPLAKCSRCVLVPVLSGGHCAYSVPSFPSLLFSSPGWAQVTVQTKNVSLQMLVCRFAVCKTLKEVISNPNRLLSWWSSCSKPFCVLYFNITFLFLSIELQNLYWFRLGF